MFCSNCGAKIEDGMRFCGECGAPVTGEEQPFNGAAPYGGNPYEASYGTAPFDVPDNEAIKKKHGLIGKLIVLGAAIIVALIVLGRVFTPEGAARDMLNAFYQCDFTKAEKCFALNPEYEDYILSQVCHGGDVNSDSLSDLEETAKEYYSKTYGDDYKVVIKVLNKEAMTANAAKSLKNEMIDYEAGYNYTLFNQSGTSALEKKLSSINKIYSVKTQVTITGKKTQTNTYKIYCVKRGLKWYVLAMESA